MPHHGIQAKLDYLAIGDTHLPEDLGKLSRAQLLRQYVNVDGRDPRPDCPAARMSDRCPDETGCVQMTHLIQEQHASIVLGTLAEILGRHAAPVAEELLPSSLQSRIRGPTLNSHAPRAPLAGTRLPDGAEPHRARRRRMAFDASPEHPARHDTPGDIFPHRNAARRAWRLPVDRVRPRQRPRRILIDGGPARLIRRFASKSSPACRPSPLELLIITHINGDHIEGVLRLLLDAEALKCRFNRIWFNGRSLNKVFNPAAPVGAVQGEMLGMLIADYEERIQQSVWNIGLPDGLAAIDRRRGHVAGGRFGGWLPPDAPVPRPSATARAQGSMAR